MARAAVGLLVAQIAGLLALERCFLGVRVRDERLAVRHARSVTLIARRKIMARTAVTIGDAYLREGPIRHGRLSRVAQVASTEHSADTASPS